MSLMNLINFGLSIGLGFFLGYYLLPTFLEWWLDL